MTLLGTLHQMGVTVTLELDGRLTLAGLNAIPEDQARQAIDLARQNKARIIDEILSTGLDAIPWFWPYAPDDPCPCWPWHAARDLREVCERTGVTAFRQREKVVLNYPPGANADLRKWTEILLKDAGDYITTTIQ